MDPATIGLILSGVGAAGGVISNFFRKAPPKQKPINITDPVANQNQNEIAQLQNLLLLQQQLQQSNDAARGLTGSASAANQMKLFDVTNDSIASLNARAADRIRSARERQELINSRIDFDNRLRRNKFINDRIDSFLDRGGELLGGLNTYFGFDDGDLLGGDTNTGFDPNFQMPDLLQPGQTFLPGVGVPLNIPNTWNSNITGNPNLNSGIGVRLANPFIR